MDMVVFDCEDDEESRPAATGDGAFNLGCLDGVDCHLMYFVATCIISGRVGRCYGDVVTWPFDGIKKSMVYEDTTGCSD